MDQQVKLAANVTAPTPSLAGDRRIPGLDGFRGIAMLVVIGHHTNYFDRVDSPAARGLKFVLDSGWPSLDSFFVLSGFLITGILLGQRSDPSYFRSFYARRALRILPVYYLAVASMFLLGPIVFPAEAGSFGVLVENQVWYWTFLVNHAQLFEFDSWAPYSTGHFWSLAVEEQFYLIWPVVVFFVSRRQLVWLCAGLVLMAPVLRIALLALESADSRLIWGLVPFERAANFMLLPTRVDALAAGALTAALLHGSVDLERARRVAGWVAVPLGIAVTGMFVYFRGPSWAHTSMQAAGYTLLAVMFAAALVRIITAPPESVTVRILELRGLRSFGKHSYAMYVFHLAIIEAVRQSLFRGASNITIAGSVVLGQTTLIVISVTLTYVVAWIVWHAFEKHFLALKRLFPRVQASSPRVTATATTPTADETPERSPAE